jgi:hypothetical protein
LAVFRIAGRKSTKDARQRKSGRFGAFLPAVTILRHFAVKGPEREPLSGKQKLPVTRVFLRAAFAEG